MNRPNECHVGVSESGRRRRACGICTNPKDDAVSSMMPDKAALLLLPRPQENAVRRGLKRPNQNLRRLP
jgi:hypothetical protein